jgi:hypothetical protein
MGRRRRSHSISRAGTGFSTFLAHARQLFFLFHATPRKVKTTCTESDDNDDGDDEINALRAYYSTKVISFFCFPRARLVFPKIVPSLCWCERCKIQ